MNTLTEHSHTLPPHLNLLADDAVVSYLRGIAKEKLELQPAQLDLIALDLPLVEGLQLDSLAQVTLLAAIEDDFGLTIEFEQREQIETVADLVRLIRERATRSVLCS